MNNATFNRALARFQRTWKEANHILQQRTHRERVKLSRIQAGKEKKVKTLNEVFASTDACHDCGRCCSKAAMDSGYYSHSERQGLLSRSQNVEEFIVGAWEDRGAEPPERCLFLSSSGCNIPAELRSTQCLTYVCHDRLGPQLVQVGLEKAFRRARGKVMKSLTTLKKLPPVRYQQNTPDFGQG